MIEMAQGKVLTRSIHRINRTIKQVNFGNDATKLNSVVALLTGVQWRYLW